MSGRSPFSGSEARVPTKQWCDEQQISDWLQRLCLGQYAKHFAKNSDAHVFRCDLFVRYRLCRRDLVLASRQARARRPYGPTAEISDLVRRWRGDPAQIAALRSCAVLAEHECADIADPAASLDPIKLGVRPSLFIKACD